MLLLLHETLKNISYSIRWEIALDFKIFLNVWQRTWKWSSYDSRKL